MRQCPPTVCGLTEAAIIGWFEDARPGERVRLLDYIWDRWST